MRHAETSKPTMGAFGILLSLHEQRHVTVSSNRQRARARGLAWITLLGVI